MRKATLTLTLAAALLLPAVSAAAQDLPQWTPDDLATIKVVPPGWQDWSAKERSAWEFEMAVSRRVIDKLAKKAGYDGEERSDMLVSFEIAVRNGVPVSDCREILMVATQRGWTASEIEALAKAMCLSEDPVAVAKAVRYGLDETAAAPMAPAQFVRGLLETPETDLASIRWY